MQSGTLTETHVPDAQARFELAQRITAIKDTTPIMTLCMGLHLQISKPSWKERLAVFVYATGLVFNRSMPTVEVEPVCCDLQPA